MEDFCGVRGLEEWMWEEVGRIVLNASLGGLVKQSEDTYWVGAVQRLDVLAPIVVSIDLSQKSYRFAVHLASPATEHEFPFK